MIDWFYKSPVKQVFVLEPATTMATVPPTVTDMSDTDSRPPDTMMNVDPAQSGSSVRCLVGCIAGLVCCCYWYCDIDLSNQALYVQCIVALELL